MNRLSFPLALVTVCLSGFAFSYFSSVIETSLSICSEEAHEPAAQAMEEMNHTQAAANGV